MVVANDGCTHQVIPEKYGIRYPLCVLCVLCG